MSRLPSVGRAEKNAMTAFLVRRSRSGGLTVRRQPTTAAAVLCFIVKLHDAGLPYPRRMDAAKHLKLSPHSIDAVLRRETERALLFERVKHEISGPDRHVLMRRDYIPARAVISIVRNAHRL